MASACPPGKSSWPELMGTIGEEAAARIMLERPFVRAYPIRVGSSVTPGFHCDRVLVWIDPNHVVIKIPTIG
ncbi:hypothetical protein CDL15_Pgr008439 [Punica granatum]|uniref:Glu S.griseus protease inhibitor-like n=1 Tax=Punica granatum TaxID=22663 RepID=A0A218WNS1_PUNGR|nr:hypothetical protein CDL15_Pgr008439 [Punica granatum]PKH48654.1 hypothetical protein CRG98_050351 [Punica granatum]